MKARAVLTALLRRAVHAILGTVTGPTDGLIYLVLLCWLGTILFLPDASFARIGLVAILAVKGAWLWPAVAAAALTPAGWLSDRPRVHLYARVGQCMWWLYFAVASAIAAPYLLVGWLLALACLVGALWIMAREGAGDLEATRPG